MRGIDPPENRPALGWALSLPREWTTTSERLVLLVLAIDSYDGESCSPNRDAILRATGLWGDTYYRALNGLCSPTSDRPPLLDVERRQGSRTVYRFRTTQSGNPDAVTQSENPDRVKDANPVGESRPGVEPEPSRGTQSGNPVGQPSRATQSGNPDHHHSLPLPDREGGMREDEGAHAPSAGAPGAARLDGEQVNTVMASLLNVLHRRWKGQHQPVVSQRARDLVGDLLAAGWTPAQIQAAVATIGTKPRNPSALLEAHLRKQLDEHEPGDYGDGTPPAVPPGGKPEPGDLCRHGVDRTRTKAGKRKTACPGCDTFREACQDVIDGATRAGFVLQQDKHDNGQRLYTLQGRGRAVVTFRTDRTGQWIDLSLEVSRPTEVDVARMKDLFTVTPTVADGWGYVFVDVTTDGEFLSALARLIDTATGWDTTP